MNLEASEKVLSSILSATSLLRFEAQETPDEAEEILGEAERREEGSGASCDDGRGEDVGVFCGDGRAALMVMPVPNPIEYKGQDVSLIP